MIDSTANQASRQIDCTLSVKSWFAAELQSVLRDFYIALDFDRRRARFGCAVSDAAIGHYCQRLDPARTIVLTCSRGSKPIAAVELHPLTSAWDDVELALADCAGSDRTTAIAHLLQIAAFAAGERGCAAFIIPASPREHGFLGLLRGMGRVRVQGDALRVELGEYSCLRRRA